MSRKTRIRLIEDIAIATGLLIGNNVDTHNLNSYQLLELILSNLEQLVTNGGLATNPTGNVLPQINTETVTSTKVLENSDAEIQNLINPTGGDINIILPSTPLPGKSFVFINQASSTGNFLTNGITIIPIDRYEIVWDANVSQWIEL